DRRPHPLPRRRPDREGPGPVDGARDPRGARRGDGTVIRVALKGLLGRKLRATLTAFAIVLGVAMISGSLVLTDTIGKSFDGVYSESYKHTDAVVTSKAAVGGADQAPAFSADVLRDVRTLPGVRNAQGEIGDSAHIVNRNGKSLG